MPASAMDDPRTAAQAPGQIEDLLLRLARIELGEGANALGAARRRGGAGDDGRAAAVRNSVAGP
jgi:hypothetical protein